MLNRLQDPAPVLPRLDIYGYCFVVGATPWAIQKRIYYRSVCPAQQSFSPSRLFDVDVHDRKSYFVKAVWRGTGFANWGVSKRDFIRAKPGRRPTMWTGPIRVVCPSSSSSLFYQCWRHIKVPARIMAHTGDMQVCWHFFVVVDSEPLPTRQRTSCRT